MNGGGRKGREEEEGGREGRREREGEREEEGGEGRGGRECVRMCLTHKSSLMYTEINRISKLSMMIDSL